MNQKKAVEAIQNAGALLVFPIDNRKEPASLWSAFYPKSKMRWDWDESGDDRVVDLWHLKTELSTTRKVIYSKWYRGRATYFSRELFTALLRALNPGQLDEGLSQDARKILSILESESPLSTKEIKRMADLQGREKERTYERALKELWSRCLIVAFGEIEDSSFPSLAVGSTRLLFEEIWNEASKLSNEQALGIIRSTLSPENLFLKFFVKLKKERQVGPSVPARKGGKRRTIGSSVSFRDL